MTYDSFKNNADIKTFEAKWKEILDKANEEYAKKDIEVKCIVCHETFVVTPDDQIWFEKHKIAIPKRCEPCYDKEMEEDI